MINPAPHHSTSLHLILMIAALLCLSCAFNAVADSQITDQSLRLAIEDLMATHTGNYPEGAQYLRELEQLNPQAAQYQDQLLSLAQKALLNNPLLHFDKVLLIRRSKKNLALSQNWESNSSLPRSGIENHLALLRWRTGEWEEVYRPKAGRFIGDVDLHSDAKRLLFSMPDKRRRWGVFELRIEDKEIRQLPLIPDKDVDNYDACYLPDGAILFCSTAPFVGVPCVKGSSHVCHLYRYEAAGGAIRRLTFEQDHDWCPTVLENGRVLYLRWEYSDIPHFASRILFHMNPDGTGQMEYYGSNSYWPNALFYARPIPHHPSQFVAIVGGHHDVPRMGELVLFDTAKGRFENEGVVQRIPGRGQPVEAKILDGLVADSWPKFLHPWPLSKDYFLVSMQPSADANWGLYLVDTFDNLLLLKEEPGEALLEAIPFMARPCPPSIPSKVDLQQKDATIYLTDVYAGPGLKGVPQGSVKQLRVISYHFAYHGMGGQQNRVGLDGPWDIKRILGTVAVEEDGSALFTVPANTPIAVQPLDESGQALQLMRSWFTAMPGETLSCAGCHEKQNSTPTLKPTVAARRAPQSITPWYGPTRGFSFQREVQPVLDAHCVRCHNGAADKPDFRDLPPIHPPAPHAGYRDECNFTPAYLALRSYLRGHTIESDLHLLPPAEFHANTTPLIQHLRRGHQGIALNIEEWSRLITWIDLNSPAHGTWTEIVGAKKVTHQRDRRRELLKRYAGIDEDPEAIFPSTYQAPQQSSATAPPPPTKDRPSPRPLLETAESLPRQRILEIAPGITMSLCFIPASRLDESTASPFWLAQYETTNTQFAAFDPAHDSHLEVGDFLQFSTQERGYPLNGPEQPVVRVSQEKALAFCRWLSEKTGEAVSLPTAEQWVFASRAGKTNPFWYGEAASDFSAFENLADTQFQRIDTYPPWSLPSGAIHPWRPAITTVDDGHKVAAPVGSFQANPWGLHDMIGNVAEWTHSPDTEKTWLVRGGSWANRPKTALLERAYPAWQGVYNVGFRIMVTEAKSTR